jgi:hypothetical protein
MYQSNSRYRGSSGFIEKPRRLALSPHDFRGNFSPTFCRNLCSVVVLPISINSEKFLYVF